MLGDAKPFPWCTFHNPNLQISYTWYIRREDGSYTATPNGLAMEMLHSLRGDRLAITVEAGGQRDSHTYALAVRNDQELAILSVNPTYDSVPGIHEIHGLSDGTYQLELFPVNGTDNNAVCKCGKPDVREIKTTKASNGTLRFMEILDKDSFVLTRIRKTDDK